MDPPHDNTPGSGAFRKSYPQPQYENSRATVDNALYGRDIEGSFVARPTFDVTTMKPAGKPTLPLNAAFSAYDYKPGHIHAGRSFMMDDYGPGGPEARKTREHRENRNLAGDQCFQALLGADGYRGETQFVPKQGFSQTKFHNGFYRRQQYDIRQDVERKQREQEQEVRQAAITQLRGGRLDDVTSFKYNGYNILTGEDFDPSKDRSRRPEARHVRDHAQVRESGMFADSAGGRLRDSTSRFFCTPQQMPHREARQQTIQTDGLTTTQRTSTVIGVGINPSQEIKSIGARENFTESVYAIRRRNAAAERSQAARAEDVAMVASLR